MINLYSNLVYVIIAISGVLPKRTDNNTKTTTATPMSDLLNKFHQNDYKIKYERSEFVRSDKSFGDFQVRTFKFNRTTPLVNATFFSNVVLGYDVEVIAQLYKFASNEYRLFPTRFQFNLCEAMTNAVMGLDKFSKCGNIVCPLLKDKHYYYCNWSPNELSFPPFVPSGRYMLELQFLLHSKEMLVTNNYGTVYRPIV